MPAEGNQVNIDEVKEKLQSVLNKLGKKLLSRIELDPTGYNKALDILDKTVDRLHVADSALFCTKEKEDGSYSCPSNFKVKTAVQNEGH